MKASVNFLGALAWLSVTTACSQQTIAVQLHPLQASGDVSYICRVDELDTTRPLGEGRPIDECNPGSISRGERDLYAMVTQTATGEVAVINVPLNPAFLAEDEGVVDIDPGVPGFGFLQIGDRPGQIVTTPGGFATFVGVGEPGKPGIFGLPTSCVSAPTTDELDRDITTWPACSLPVTPGAITVAVDPRTPDGVAKSCDRSDGFLLEGQTDALAGLECPADLAAEDGPVGRRKLLVALPDRGSIAVIDAQWLLNQKAGEFVDCKLEAEVALKVELPVIAIAQRLPEDLRECGPPPVGTPETPPAHVPTPSDFELIAGQLYVSDATAPVIHRLNAEQPCALAEGPPLLTRSLENTKRVVTTSKVAVSPLSPAGKRFAYAIDQYDSPLATVMMFDVSPGSTDPTPIVREGSSFLPFETPDRIQFSGSPKDVTFVLRDRPKVDDLTGNVVVGTSCDPDPRNTVATSPGAAYRPTSGFVSGARASELRGLFASVLLSNGQISMVDIEDFDAPCRRPRLANLGVVEDFHGCKGDPTGLPACRDGANQGETCYETDNGTATVSDEVSCNMIEPHRQRSAAMGLTNDTFGMHAPSLRALPQATFPPSASQGTFRSRPKVLGVPFPDAPAQVYVGTTLYSPAPDVGQSLDMDPENADRYSLVLPFAHPRSYTASNDQSLTYEGAITVRMRNGFLETRGQGDPSLPVGTMRLRDPTAGYCDAGVSDPEVMRQVGADRFGLSGAELETFAEERSDYAVIISDFPAEDDVYWSQQPDTCTRSACELVFGAFDDRELLTARDFQIVDAQQQILSVKPRREKGSTAKDEAARVVRDGVVVEMAAGCCFPSGSEYVVRASKQWILRGTTSGFRHQVYAVERKDAAGEKILNCELDCYPRKRYFESRVFEISAANCTGDDDCSVGVDPSSFCVAKDAAAGVTLTETAARCIHQTPTERLAIYRGTDASLRDTQFTWQVTGGFLTQRIDLSVIANYVSPVTVVGLPQFSWLTVIDSAALGLTLVSLDSLAVLTPPLN